jgi:hypothetical protein
VRDLPRRVHGDVDTAAFEQTNVRAVKVASLSEALLREAPRGSDRRKLTEHYSHVRMAAKRSALDKLESGLMGRAVESQEAIGKVN